MERNQAIVIAGAVRHIRRQGFIMNQNRNQGSDGQQGGSARNGQKQGRGFAGMDAARQREIASKGGKAAHEKGTAHEFTSEEARVAGRKGGEVVSQNREHMAMIGREGGQARGQRHRAAQGGEFGAAQEDVGRARERSLSGDESLSRDDSRSESDDELRASDDIGRGRLTEQGSR